MTDISTSTVCSSNTSKENPIKTEDIETNAVSLKSEESITATSTTTTNNNNSNETTTTVEIKKEEEDDATATNDIQSTTIKYDSEIKDGVTERLQFFFSDANIRQDHFVRRHLLVGSDHNNNNNTNKVDRPGYITIDTLLKFNTIKKYTTDPNVIVDVIETKLGNTLQLSDDKKAVTTIVKFTKDKMDDNIPLTLYITGVPYEEETKRYTVSVEDIRNLFTQYGTVALVKFRFKRHTNDDDEIDGDLQPSKQPSTNNDDTNRGFRKRYPVGAGFVEFTSMDSLEKAAADVVTSNDGITCDPPRKLQLRNSTLQIVLLKDFIDSKRKRKQPSSSSNENAKDEKDTATEEQKTTEADNNDDAPKSNDDIAADDDKKITDAGIKFVLDWKPGCVIKLKGVPDNCDREALLQAIGTGLDMTVDQVKELKIYVDYSRGQEDGAIRFPEPSTYVTTICTKLSSGELSINSNTVTQAYILVNEEEQQYWDNFIEFKTLQMRQKKASSSSGGGGGGNKNYHHHNNNNKNHHHHRNKRHRKN